MESTKTNKSFSFTHFHAKSMGIFTLGKAFCHLFSIIFSFTFFYEGVESFFANRHFFFVGFVTWVIGLGGAIILEATWNALFNPVLQFFMYKKEVFAKMPEDAQELSEQAGVPYDEALARKKRDWYATIGVYVVGALGIIYFNATTIIEGSTIQKDNYTQEVVKDSPAALNALYRNKKDEIRGTFEPKKEAARIEEERRMEKHAGLRASLMIPADREKAIIEREQRRNPNQVYEAAWNKHAIMVAEVDKQVAETIAAEKRITDTVIMKLDQEMALELAAIDEERAAALANFNTAQAKKEKQVNTANAVVTGFTIGTSLLGILGVIFFQICIEVYKRNKNFGKLSNEREYETFQLNMGAMVLTATNTLRLIFLGVQNRIAPNSDGWLQRWAGVEEGAVADHATLDVNNATNAYTGVNNSNRFFFRQGVDVNNRATNDGDRATKDVNSSTDAETLLATGPQPNRATNKKGRATKDVNKKGDRATSDVNKSVARNSYGVGFVARGANGWVWKHPTKKGQVEKSIDQCRRMASIYKARSSDSAKKNLAYWRYAVTSLNNKIKANARKKKD